MLELNLPSFECKIKQKEGRLYIYDSIRKKYLVLTPEEWVRQHFVHHLIKEYGVSKNLISLEFALDYNNLSKRSDIIVWSRERYAKLIVECKAPYITLNSQTISQVSLYNHRLRAPYLGITNGIKHYFFQRVGQNWEPVEGLEFIRELQMI